MIRLRKIARAGARGIVVAGEKRAGLAAEIGRAVEARRESAARAT